MESIRMYFHHITTLLFTMGIALIHTYVAGSATAAFGELTIAAKPSEEHCKEELTKKDMLGKPDETASAGSDQEQCAVSKSSGQSYLPPSASMLKRSPASQCLAMFLDIPVPELKATTHEQVTELMNIFIFLYAYAIQLDLADPEFFHEKPPEEIILNNLNTLAGLLTRGNIGENTPRFIGMAYEAIQIFDLVGCLFLEHDLLEKPPAVGASLAEAFESSRNTHHHITIAEEWVLKFIDAQYDRKISDPLAPPYFTSQVLDIALNLGRKFLEQLQSTCNRFVPYITDDALIREYDAFIQTPAGKRRAKDIERTGIRHPLEEYHGHRSMKATRKAIFLQQKMRDSRSYRFFDFTWINTMANTIATYTGKPHISHEKLYQAIAEETQKKYRQQRSSLV